AQFLLNTADASDRHLAHGLVAADRIFARLDLGGGPSRPIAEWFPSLTDAEQRRVREQVVELILLEARARVLLAARRGRESTTQSACRRAVARLELAERTAHPPPGAIFAERSRYHAARGEAGLAERARGLADMNRPASAHEWSLLGTSLLAAGNPAG